MQDELFKKFIDGLFLEKSIKLKSELFKTYENVLSYKNLTKICYIKKIDVQDLIYEIGVLCDENVYFFYINDDIYNEYIIWSRKKKLEMLEKL